MADIKATISDWKNKAKSVNAVDNKELSSWKRFAKKSNEDIEEDPYNERRSFRQQWADVRKEERSNKKLAKSGNVSGMAQNALENTQKIATYHLYSKAILALIETYGLTFLYLIFHFFMKYFASSPRFCHFVGITDIKDQAGATVKVAKGEDKPDFLMIFAFLVVFGILVFLICLIVFLQLSPAILFTNAVNVFFDWITGYGADSNSGNYVSNY